MDRGLSFSGREAFVAFRPRKPAERVDPQAHVAVHKPLATRPNQHFELLSDLFWLQEVSKATRSSET